MFDSLRRFVAQHSIGPVAQASASRAPNRAPLRRVALVAAIATAVIVAALVTFSGKTDARGGIFTVKRCCLVVKVTVNGTISVDYGRNPNAYLSGKRNFRWTSMTVGKYRYENRRRPFRAAPDLIPVRQSEAKFGTSEIGDIVYNVDSPDPPRPERVSVHECEERVTSGGKWLVVDNRFSQVVDLRRKGNQVVMDVGVPGPPWRLRGTQFEGDCEGAIYSHNDEGYTDGLPLKTFNRLVPPIPLDRLRAPSKRKLRKASDFGDTYRYSATHPPQRDPSNARHHVTKGKNTVEVTFRYVEG